MWRIPAIVVIFVAGVSARHVFATIPLPSSGPSASVLQELIRARALPPVDLTPRAPRPRPERRPTVSFHTPFDLRSPAVWTPRAEPALQSLTREPLRLQPAPALRRQARLDLPSIVSQRADLSRVISAPTVRTLPRSPAFQLPETGVEFLLADRSLSAEQRSLLSDAMQRFEERDRAYRDSLRDELGSLEDLLRREIDECSAERILERLRGRREEESRLLRATLADLHGLLTRRQWRRFSDWIRKRPWVPLHRYSDDEDR